MIWLSWRQFRALGSAALALCDVDDKTLGDKPNAFLPIDRKRGAAVVKRLAAAGAAVIAYDTEFTESTTTAAGYLAFSRHPSGAITSIGRTWLASTLRTASTTKQRGEPNTTPVAPMLGMTTLTSGRFIRSASPGR